MSWLGFDLSVEGCSPVWLYQFASGVDVWRYTSIKADIVKGGYTWTSSAITHDDIAQRSDEAQDNLKIIVPLTSDVAVAHMGYARGQATTVTVFSCDFSDVEVVMQWKGKVLHSNPTSLVAMTFECESIGTSAAKEGLRMYAQRMCGAVHYGPGCNLNRADFARSSHATATAGRTVTVTEASEMNDIVGGMFSTYHTTGPWTGTGEDRTIVAADGDLLTLQWPISDLAALIAAADPGGAHVFIYPACRRNLSDCRTKFGNPGHYRGYPNMDGRNPMDGYTNVF